MAKMVDKYCSKQDKQHSGLLSMRVCTLLFNNRFNPAMSDKTLIKPLKAQKSLKRKKSVYSVFSVVNNGKWVLPTSCRFNRRSRCEPVSGVAISSIKDVRLLWSFHSLAMTTLTGAMHQNKSCQNLVRKFNGGKNE